MPYQDQERERESETKIEKPVEAVKGQYITSNIDHGKAMVSMSIDKAIPEDSIGSYTTPLSVSIDYGVLDCTNWIGRDCSRNMVTDRRVIEREERSITVSQ